jgi:O-antigen/teichoic acid export membrane protein
MFKNLVYSLITKGTVALVNLFILIISSRYLGVSSRGEISIFILNITIIQIINEVYTGYSLIHFIPKFDLKKIIVTGLLYTLIFCSLNNVILVFLNKQVQGYEWFGYFLSLLIIVNTFNCVILLGKENIKWYNILSVIQPLILLLGLLFCIFILHMYTFAAYVYPLLFSFALAFLVSFVNVFTYNKMNTSAKNFELKPIIINGFFSQAALLAYLFGNRYSYYWLPDKASVGLYSSASSIIESVLIIANAVSPVLLSKVANEGNTQKSVGITLALSKVSLLLSIFALIILLVLPETFFLAILGSGFRGIKDLMMLYAPGILMVSLFISISNFFAGIGKQKLVLLCYSVGFFSTLILAPILISRFNVAGAAYNANIAYFLVGICFCFLFTTSNKITL